MEFITPNGLRCSLEDEIFISPSQKLFVQFAFIAVELNF